MYSLIKKIPAGNLIVPMITSAILYTLWPNLFNIGGLTQTFFGSGSSGFIIATLTFCAGLGLKLSSIGDLFKRHGVLLVVKFIILLVASLLYTNFFGEDGILGISALAFTIMLSSTNPAVYASLMEDYGNDLDRSAFGLLSLFTIPSISMIVYSMSSGSGSIDWMPVISTLIPFLIGIILGNLDPNLNKIFATGPQVLIPILGWQIGQTMNLIEGIQSGFSAIILAVLYYLIMEILVLVDTKVLKNDGIVAMSMNAAAGTSASFAAIVAVSNPQAAPFVDSAVVQIVAVVIITSIVTPLRVGRRYNKLYPDAEKAND